MGMIWRRMMPKPETPEARAASTNSFCLMLRVWPRTIRAMVSHSTAPTATNSRIRLRSNTTIRMMTKKMKGRE